MLKLISLLTGRKIVLLLSFNGEVYRTLENRKRCPLTKEWKNAIITLNRMKEIEINLVKKAEIENSISYLKSSKYYSEMNRDSNY